MLNPLRHLPVQTKSESDQVRLSKHQSLGDPDVGTVFGIHSRSTKSPGKTSTVGAKTFGGRFSADRSHGVLAEKKVR